MTASVAIPVLDGGARLGEVLEALAVQDAEHELVVVDSGSTDGSQALARRHGARVVEIPRAEFSHGGTRNRLMELTTGDHVAFLTQDSVPANQDWLTALLGGFELADDVALVTGPQRPRADASPMVRRELIELFERFGPTHVGGTFFSSANGAVARRAWERVRFRPVAYGEDQMLAADMAGAGLRTAYVAEAAVVHSHDLPPHRALRRYFEDFRALARANGLREPLSPRWLAATVRNDVAADRAFMRRHGMPVQTWRSLTHQTARALGRSLGTNADRFRR